MTSTHVTPGLRELQPQRRAGPALRITFLIRSLEIGGAERQLVTLARGLHARGHAVKVLTFYGGGALERELTEAGVRVRSLGKGGRWDVVPFFVALLRTLRQEPPDVLHGYLEMANLLTALAKPFLSGTRVVWGVRASHLDVLRCDWLSRINVRLLQSVASTPDLIVVNSRAGWDHHRSAGFPATVMRVVANGIDTDQFRPNPQAGRRTRAEWGITPDQVLLGLVGRLDPVKDHPTFLRAAALLARECDDVRFVCVGDGPMAYTEELWQLGRALGLENRLLWVPGRPDTPAVFNALDVLCSASTSEGFPNVIAEAMACGVPAVVTDVGDSAWIVGESGAVVPPGNAQALAAALRAQLDRTADGHIHDLVRQRVVEQFGVERLLDATEEALWAMG